MTDYIIPLAPAQESFLIVLAGREYRLTTRWIDVANTGAGGLLPGADAEGGWTLDIAGPDGAPVLAGIPLVTGCDLLEQHAHLNFGGMLRVNAELPPGPDNLGTEVELVFTAKDEA